jgi:dTDP-4-amino-4,6-dideoxygalactose transaminase
VVVHYAGVAVDMDAIMDIAERKNIFVVEDAAQAIDGYYKDRPLGGIGHLGCFSFHETKNIVSGEGGLLVINDARFVERAEILWEKGTNRSAFVRGEVDKYGWVDIGSSFLPSELIAAYLLAQLESVDDIQAKRIAAWQYYHRALTPLAESFKIKLPQIPEFARHNGHIYYVICEDISTRDWLIDEMKKRGVQAFFHYPSLHLSKYFLGTGASRQKLSNAERFSGQLIRLPLYVSIRREEQDIVVETLRSILAQR